MNQRARVAMADLTRWLFFSVLLGSVPLIAAATRLYVGGQWSLAGLAGNGDLLLAVSVICGSAIGALMASGDDYRIGKIACGGSALVLLAVSTYLYQEFNASDVAPPLDVATRRAEVSVAIAGLGLVSVRGA